ncbi:MAG: hypothetical protein VX438_03490 [Planctomycetota bacterium]|nr:hypothetical protein [Planctomycetota bacterium]
MWSHLALGHGGETRVDDKIVNAGSVDVVAAIVDFAHPGKPGL